MESKICFLTTLLGQICLVLSREGLLNRVILSSLEWRKRKKLEEIPPPEGVKEIFQEYFSGQKMEGKIFPFLNLNQITFFQRAVYQKLEKISWGEVISYRGLASSLGTSPRAVGQALKKNPWPLLIPCHRVVRKNGSLGGFNQGLAWKKKLLTLEGVKIKNAKVIG